MVAEYGENTGRSFYFRQTGGYFFRRHRYRPQMTFGKIAAQKHYIRFFGIDGRHNFTQPFL